MRRGRSSRPCRTGDIFAALQAGYGAPGQVVGVSAVRAHPAHLLKNSLLFHAAQKLHPLKRCDVGIGAFTEHREDVTLQGTDDSLGGTRISVGET